MTTKVTGRSLAEEITDSFRLVIAASGALLAVILATVVWLTTMGAPAVARAGAAYRAGEEVHSALLETGSSVRAYVVTGLPDATTSYESAHAAFERDVNDLLASDDPTLRRDAETLRTTEQRWEDGWVRRALDPATRTRITARGVNPDRLTRFVVGGWRGFLAAQAAQAKVTRDAQSEDHAVRRTATLVVGSAALVAVFVGVAVVVSTIRRRRGLRRRVLDPVASLLDKVRQVGRGDFATSFALDGPREVLELRDELVDMTASLRLQQQVLEAHAEEAAQAARRLEQVVAFAHDVTSSLTLSHVLDATTSSAGKLLNSDRARVWLLQPDGETLRLEHATHPDDRAAYGATHQVGGLGAGRAIAEQRLSYSLGLTGEEYSETEGVLALSMPLVKGTRPIGVLEVALTHRTRRLRADAVQILQAMAGHAATAIDAALLYARVESMSLSDALTGLANRRRMDQDLAMEVERAMRQGGSMSFLMLDIDNFKHVNDTYGHAAGDDALRQVAALLAGEMRLGDTAYRYGGEEFAVLVRDTDEAGAKVVAERLRRAVADRIRDAGGETMSISIGIASLPTHALSANEMVRMSDAALYAAKHGGRNRVVTAPLVLPAQRVG